MQQIFKLPMGLQWKHVGRKPQSRRPDVCCSAPIIIGQRRERATGIGVSEVVRECRDQTRRNSHEQSHRSLMRAEFQTNHLPVAIGFVKRIQHRLGIAWASVIVRNGGDLEEHGVSISLCLL